jgi:hypothetical protein
MDDIAVFANYAAAFEEAYASDDWSKVRDAFAEDAVYEAVAPPPFGGTWKGRDAIVAHLVESVNGFDRTFDERLLSMTAGPSMEDGAVFVGWSVTYRKSGQSDLAIAGEERAWIDDGRIVRLEDRIPNP